MNDQLHRERKTGLCGVLLDLAVKNKYITKRFKRTWYCNSVLIILALRFRYKRYPLHVVLLIGYLLGKTSHYTCRGHKRSSDRERYPFPIQVSLSCCASSKGTPERTRCANKPYVDILGNANCFRKYTCFACGEDTVLEI